MKRLKYFSEVGATAACTLRLITAAAYSGLDSAERQKACEQQKRHLAVADLWFGSVRMVEALKLLWQVKEKKNQQPGQPEEYEYRYVFDRTKGENPNAHEIVAAVKMNQWLLSHYGVYGS